MKLFTLGPVEMFPYTLEESSKQIPYFRTPEFSKVVLECEEMLKTFAHAEDAKDRVVFLTASGTGAMEASVINCLSAEDNVLIIDGGSFGHRFVQICEMHGIPHKVLKLELGERLTQDRLDEYKDEKLTALLVNIHETSTGQLYPISMISEFCDKKNLFLIVDAISSFLADPFDFSKNHIDVAIFSSQKALALAPGLSAVVLSARALERAERIESKMMYFDFKAHLKDGERGQTPFTPAVGVILQLHDRLLHIKEEGLEQVLWKAEEIAADFRKRLKNLPIKMPDYPLSNACTPLIFEKGAKQLYEKLKEEYQLVLTPNGGDLADKIVRVGHLGNHTKDENELLIEKMKEIIYRDDR